MADVFLSYRNLPDRRAFVDRLAAILEAYGLKVWWDYGLEAGISYEDQIFQELQQAKAVVPIWCSESIRSEWVLREAALGAGKLVPARLQKVAPPSSFEAIQAADLTDWNGSVDHEPLTRFIKRLALQSDRELLPRVSLIGQLRILPPIKPLPALSANSRSSRRKGLGIVTLAATTLGAAGVSAVIFLGYSFSKSNDTPEVEIVSGQSIDQNPETNIPALHKISHLSESTQRELLALGWEVSGLEIVAQRDDMRELERSTRASVISSANGMGLEVDADASWDALMQSISESLASRDKGEQAIYLFGLSGARIRLRDFVDDDAIKQTITDVARDPLMRIDPEVLSFEQKDALFEILERSPPETFTALEFIFQKNWPRENATP